MLTSEFDYELPAERIAQHPGPRGESRLLVVGSDALEHRRIGDLPRLLDPGDLLVLNDTRVIPARLYGRRESGGAVELLLARRLDTHGWLALVRPGRRARAGTTVLFDDGLSATVEERVRSGQVRVRFSEPVEPHLERIGHVPLPPYIRRPDAPEDRARYQTVYARAPGAVAAPTAGLHFTGELLERLREAEVERAELTLHVGIGTFKPVRAELVHEHTVDGEQVEIAEETAAAIDRTRERGGRVVAVGTTVVRALESAATGSGGRIRPFSGKTELFIYPGFEFRVVDRLLTNFHLPRSSLLMLVSAFGGRRRILSAYAEAIREEYRFYSYGDAMLVGREPAPREPDSA